MVRLLQTTEVVPVIVNILEFGRLWLVSMFLPLIVSTTKICLEKELAIVSWQKRRAKRKA